MFGSLWLAVFGRFVAAKLERNEFALSFVFVPAKPRPASRALIRAIVQRCSALRTPNTGVDERTSHHSNRPEHDAKKQAEQGIISLAGNDHAGGDRCDPDPQTKQLHHAHPLSTHISSRIGPATRQARRSRAILRVGSMLNRIDTDGRNVKRLASREQPCDTMHIVVQPK